MDSALSLIVGGIPVTVYGLNLASTSKPISVLFMLHGRTFHSKSSTTLSWIEGVLTRTASNKLKGNGDKDLIIVSFDHRNHGERMVDVKKNGAWTDQNLSHAVDMYSIFTGTTKDLSFLIDFLPSVLFPNDERVITEYYVMGISLGGHSSWAALAHEPRISLGIPVIGAPSYLALMSHRAATSTPPIAIGPPHFPSTLLSYIAKNDPCNTPLINYKGKKILALSGKDDQLVNFYKGESDKFIEKLVKEGVDVVYWVQEGVGHACSPEMVVRAADFIWEHGLSSKASL